VAAKCGQTIITFAFFASITGIGGGTMRDLLIGAPVFWMQDSKMIAACLVVALAVYLLPRRIWSDRAIDWFDGVGLAAYSVYGATTALSYDSPPLPAVIMGIVTACLGGILRDVLAGIPSIVIRPEIYVSAAAVSSGSFVAVLSTGLTLEASALIGALLGFSLRALAITKGFELPKYRN